MKMKFRDGAWILLFGSLWGLSEVIAGEALYKASVPRASFWLSSWALVLLSFARGIMDKPGSSAAIGAVASVYRLVNAAPFFCHLLGIFFLGAAFDLAVSLLTRSSRGRRWRMGLAGMSGAYGGYALFALVATYVLRYEFWVEGGWLKVIDHIFVSGSIVAALAVFLVPLGYFSARRGQPLILRRPRLVSAAAFFLTAIAWLVGVLMP